MAPHRDKQRSSAAIHSHTSPSTSSCYGEPHQFDCSFRGPVPTRSCTDVVCCLIFIIAIFFYVALGMVAWLHGDPRKVLHPTDSYGQFCGQTGTSNGYVFKCPDRFATFTEMQLKNKLSGSYWEYYRQFCKPGFDDPDKPVAQVLRDEDCPSMIVPSRPFLQRCLPDFMTLNRTVTVANRTRFTDPLERPHHVTELQQAANGITGLVDAKDVGLKIVEDYAKSWPWILIGLLLSMAVSLLFILLLRVTAGLLLWTTISTILLLLAYGMWCCYMRLSQLRHTPGSSVSIREVGLQTDPLLYLQLTQTWNIALICLGVTEASILLTLIFLRRRVQVAIALLKEASKAISHIMSTLFFPIVTFLLMTVCLSHWAATAIHLASSGEAVYKVLSHDANCPYANSTCTPECVFAFYGGETSYHRYLFLLQLANLLLFLWLVNFSLALQQLTLAGTFASYYWARRKPQDIPSCPVFSSFSMGLRYHTGSLAFGALILSVAQLVQIILQYVEQRLKGVNNSLSRFILTCLRCCFWCLEKCIRYMNRNAYIMMAIYGKNFCTSAREAFFLLMRNVARVAVLDRVTDFLLFLAKVLIAGGVGVVAFLFLNGQIPALLPQEEVPHLHYHWLPLLTVVIGAYLIAHGFFSVYAMCVDTLFLCFCDDLERNDGSPQRPYLMSPELHTILGKSNHVA